MIITPPAFGQTQADFLHAIGTVESGHDDNAVGDGGASGHKKQATQKYWLKVKKELDSLVGPRSSEN